MVRKTGIYTKEIHGTTYEYRVLKVMKKTLDIELRTFNENGESTGEVWFSYRLPQERINLSCYDFQPLE